MIPFGVPFFATTVSDNGASYVGGWSGGGTSPSPASRGAVEGDLAVVSAFNTASPSSGSGGAWIGVSQGVAYRQLTAADLNTGIATNVAVAVLAIYRDVRSLALVSSATVGQVAPGFAKNVSHAGLFAYSKGTPASFISSPPTFSERGGGVQTENGAQRTISISDRLYPTNTLYVDNTPFVQTGGDDRFQDFIRVFELRFSA